MAQLFKWTVTRCFPIVRDGDIKGAGVFEIVYLPNNFRNTSPMKRVKAQATFKNTYKTAIGNGIKLEVALSMIGERYQVGNPDTGVPVNIWEAKKITLKATKIDYPTGYSCDVQPVIFKPIKPKVSKTVESPIFYIDLKVSGGPMIGSWTDYSHRIMFDPQAKKIK